MSGLTEVLRDRASRRGRTARVSCGALGTVTVEALSPVDCAALSRQGRRALFYAACRELQESGEALRREGLLYRPDEIMGYVTEEEAAEAVRAVRSLSGLEPEDAGEADRRNGTGREERSGTRAAEVREGPAKRLDGEKKRCSFVQEPGTEFPEVRPELVQEKETLEERLEPAEDAGTEIPEVRLKIVQNQLLSAPDSAGPPAKIGLPEGKHGQASHEFSEPPGKRAKKFRAASVLQNLLKGGRKPIQDIAVQAAFLKTAHETESEFRPPPEGRTHEIKSELRETTHETESEFRSPPEGRAHEIKSELRETTHETESEFRSPPEGRAHEIKSEFRETAHETESEFRPPPEGRAHEIKSEFRETAHETESEFRGAQVSGLEAKFAEKREPPDMEAFAWSLLEGLRRAAQAR